MAACKWCGISLDDLPEGYVCADCVRTLQPTQRARDFVHWLENEHPEIYERALLDSADKD